MSSNKFLDQGIKRSKLEGICLLQNLNCDSDFFTGGFQVLQSFFKI